MLAAACCTARNAPVSIQLFTLDNTPISSAFPAAHPMRQPVIPNVFDSEWNSIATSRAPDSSSTLGAR